MFQERPNKWIESLKSSPNKNVGSVVQIFISYFPQQSKYRVMNKDQWYNVLEFSRTVHADLSNYDEDGACKYIMHSCENKFLKMLNMFMHSEALTDSLDQCNNKSLFNQNVGRESLDSTVL